MVPVPFENLPGGQSEQIALPAEFAKEPGLHCVQTDSYSPLANSLYLPREQSVQLPPQIFV